MMTILCDRTCSNFLNYKVVGNEKLRVSLARLLNWLARSLAELARSLTH